ncbi:SDR family NAD(P)-dependent oxidoreductase [Bacteroidales bacterium OttesenSCG-928-K03]|nr:SDR family NAD(P)-dependent oxidoreductase [Odoribacter sp. OttesenSCG-928-L07]MDL2238800.1 SDR family NAD(P)-dependent oxidoreductase [Bacteroidales bacterium OttesenSCG-928-L14]MDL2240783.1 SDR family NAD(P)-dependent oxidoreductase [Bacteroidales bacterium OttesenSCG-928-K22]MDL2242179.1 SDR family NAD(P)-dependent oxidoreductase [Bacteroidales bacterium OttesenSCG-928-K03]
MINFKDKTILITGAGSGIGEAITCRFAELGANVILTGLDLESLDKVKNTCERFGVKAYSCECDFSNYKNIDKLVAFIKENNFVIDVFVLNAGISQRAFALETDFSVDKKIMDINFFSSVYLIKSLSESIKATEHVSIAVTTSISGLFGFPLRSAYCASKHALFGFYESLDLENDNIDVTFLIPGRINTQISKSAMLASGERYDKMDKGQATGMDVNKCAKIAVKAIAKRKHRKLIGNSELLMVYIHKYIPALYYKLAKKISST